MEDSKEKRPWYKKKRYIIPLAIFGLMVIGSIDSQSTTTTSVSPFSDMGSTKVESVPIQIVSPKPTIIVPTNDSASLSNNNHYTNVDGDTVHSPAFSNTGSMPAGASARCRDGTYSFSQNRRGTCSHHGGVAQWY